MENRRKNTRLRIVLSLLIAVVALIAVSQAQAGVYTWDHRYNGPGELSTSDIGKGICLSPDGALLCTGQASVDAASGYSDIVVLCLEQDGTERWSYLYDSGDFDMGYAIATDESGNVYVASESSGNGGDADFAVLSLTPDGQFRWIYRFDPAGDIGFASDVAVGPDGNIYACGNAVVESGNSADAVVVSLTPGGEERWVNTFNGAKNRSDIAWDIATDDAGNIYSCGLVCEHDRAGDLIVASLSPEGGVRWSYIYNGTAGGEDAAYMVVAGDDGNIYAAGKSTETGRSRDLIVVSLTSGGSERWVYLYNGTAGVHDLANCLSWGTDGNIYVGGKTVETAGDAFTVISLTPDGQERWRFLPTWDGYNGVWSITTDNDGNVYAGGWIGEKLETFPYYLFDFAVASISSAGSERWVFTYPGSDPLTGVVDQVVFDGSNRIYAVGFSPDMVWGPEFTVVSLSTTPRYRIPANMR